MKPTINVSSADPAEVTAALINADGTSNVYITDDPATNDLTLTLTNGLSQEIVFPPGQPVAYDQLPPGQAAVYIFLGPLLDNADIAGISLTAPGWAAGTFTDASTKLKYLGLAPANQVKVQSGGALTFKLTRVLVPGQPRSGNADIMLAGATGITPDQGSPSVFINIANPPTPGKKTLGLEIDFTTPSIYTGKPQSLTLHLVNGGQTSLVPGGTNDWHGSTPTFQLTLVYGTGAGAITTLEGAAGISVNISDVYGNVWKPVQRQNQGQSPYWIMQPDPNGGGTVLGTGSQASIEFAITGVEATLPAGLDHAITLAYVSWSDIPGYNDGSTALIIIKYAGPKVVSFTASPLIVPFGQPSVQTVLTWDTEHTTGVRFDAPQIGPAQTFYKSGSGPIPGGINAPLGATMTVIAYKDIPAEHKTKARHPRQPRQPEDDEITATASLRIGGGARTDVSAGIGSLASIVFPPGSARAFAFQGILGSSMLFQQTKAAIMDIASRSITGVIDLASLIPGGPVGTVIEATVPSPDGKTIHVLVSQHLGSNKRTYYLLPLQVANATYGKPVSLGALVPSGSPAFASLLATQDGQTAYVCAQDSQGPTCILARDAGTYANKGSWTSMSVQQIGPPVIIGANHDGSVLLLGGWTAIMAVSVRAGFTELATLKVGGYVMTPWGVSADASRVYGLSTPDLADQNPRSVVTCAVDLGTGSLSLANKTSLGQGPTNSGTNALSADGKTFYVWTDPDTLTAIDTTTFVMTPYVCGVNGSFTPLLIASVPQSPDLYCTGAGGVSNGTVEVVTIY